MVGVAQLVEHQVVALVAVGSSPIAHPIEKPKTIAAHPRHPAMVFSLARP